MKPQIINMNSIELIKSLKDTNDPEAIQTACMLALNHLYRGAMDGASNPQYIEATNYTFDMLKNMINQI